MTTLVSFLTNGFSFSDYAALGAQRTLQSVSYSIAANFRSVTGNERPNVSEYRIRFTDPAKNLAGVKLAGQRVDITHSGQLFARCIVIKGRITAGRVVELECESLATKLKVKPSTKNDALTLPSVDRICAFGMLLTKAVYMSETPAPPDVFYQHYVCDDPARTITAWVYRGDNVAGFTPATTAGQLTVTSGLTPPIAQGTTKKIAVATTRAGGTMQGILQDLRARAGLTAAEMLDTFANDASPLAAYKITHLNRAGFVLKGELLDGVGMVCANADCALVDVRGVLKLVPYTVLSLVPNVLALTRNIQSAEFVDLEHAGVSKKGVEYFNEVFHDLSTEVNPGAAYSVQVAAGESLGGDLTQNVITLTIHPDYQNSDNWEKDQRYYTSSLQINEPAGLQFCFAMGELWNVTRSIPPIAGRVSAGIAHGALWPGDAVTCDTEELPNFTGLVLSVEGDLLTYGVRLTACAIPTT